MYFEVLFVGIGMEYVFVKDFGVVVIVKYDGIVEYVEVCEIWVCCVFLVDGKEVIGGIDKYILCKFVCFN